MSNYLIENSELTTLAYNPNHFMASGNYESFLGIGEGKSKAKKAAGKAASSATADENWKNNTRKAYTSIKGDAAATSTAVSRIDNKENIGNIFLVTQDFGIPKTKTDLQSHNSAVSAYIKYNYAGLDGISNDCLRLNDLAGIIDADVEAANKRLGAGATGAAKAELQALANVQAKIKKLIALNRCLEKAELLEQQKSKEETLSTLKEATGAASGVSDNTIKYFAYGLGGLVILTGLIFLIRNR